MSTLVVVDGHNVFNDAGRYLTGKAPDAAVKAYFRHWFDIDRLVRATAGPSLTLHPVQDLGIVVFHSKKAMGDQKDVFRLDGDDCAAFWARQGSSPDTSTMLVEVPGARKGKDVGVDMAIAVYLFETVERWDRVLLFTNDSDFVPAVWALRRRGKRVYCASRDESSPLVQACQSFFRWNDAFLETDVALLTALLPGGALDTFLEKPWATRHAPPTVERNGGGLSVTGTYKGGADSVMNEVLRDAKLSGHVHATERGTGFNLGPSPSVLTSVFRALVTAALERHPEPFVQSGWWRYFEASQKETP